MKAGTPPKYAAQLGERNARVTLEERLHEFVQWLAEECDVFLIRPSAGAESLDGQQVSALIDEYVNS